MNYMHSWNILYYFITNVMIYQEHTLFTLADRIGDFIIIGSTIESSFERTIDHHETVTGILFGASYHCNTTGGVRGTSLAFQGIVNFANK